MEQKYIDFFEEIKKIQDKIKAQKKRGLNDFNLLTIVRKYHEEIYLHSKMIGTLLNPNGLHYQDTLFLELFLQIIDFKDFNLKNTKIFLEYKNIDLYITDGNKHIIIENKIWAKDQKEQISRYVEIIQKENPKLKAETQKSQTTTYLS